MKKTELDLLYQYFINEIAHLENDVVRLRQSLRYRNIDTLDCIEYMLALERLTVFKEFTKNVRYILKLKKECGKDE